MSLKLGECAICFEDIKVGGSLRCGHVLDYDCLKHSLSTQPNTCPICRQCDRRPPVRLYFDKGLDQCASTTSGSHVETPTASEDTQGEGAAEKKTRFRSKIFQNMQNSLTEMQVMLDQVLAQLSQEQEEKERVLKKYRVAKDRLAEGSVRRSLAFAPDLNTSVARDEHGRTRVGGVVQREASSTRHDQDGSSSVMKIRRQTIADAASHGSKRHAHHHASTPGPDAVAGPSGSHHRPITPTPRPTTSRAEPCPLPFGGYTVLARPPSPISCPPPSRPHRGAERGRNYQANSQQRAVVIIDADPAPPRKRPRHSA